MPNRKITDLAQIAALSDNDLLFIRELVAGYDRNMTVAQLASKLTAVKNTKLSITGFITASTTLSVISSGTNYNKTGDNGDLQISSGNFLTVEYLQLFLNGVALVKGVEAIWMSNSTFTLSIDLDVGDVVIILS